MGAGHHGMKEALLRKKLENMPKTSSIKNGHFGLMTAERRKKLALIKELCMDQFWSGTKITIKLLMANTAKVKKIVNGHFGIMMGH